MAAPGEEQQPLLRDELHGLLPFRVLPVVGCVIVALRRPSLPRSRAGTPLASAPGGTSRVTTAPAPVYAPSPTSTGATSTVFDPVRTPSPILVRCLSPAVVVGGDRARAEVGAGADLGVADVGEVRHLGALADLGVLDLDERARRARRRRGGCPAAATRTGRRCTSSPISASRATVWRIDRVARRRRCRRAGVSGPITEPRADRRCGLRGSCRAGGARRARARPSRRCRCGRGRPS